MRKGSRRWSWGVLASVVCAQAVVAQAQDDGYRELQGTWQIVELVDNGRVIPAAAIPSWLPSGGVVDIIDNALVFRSPANGQRHARSFVVDATRLPKLFNLVRERELFAQGIYQVDQGRLVVCLTPVSLGPRPTDFSAAEGSRRMLMVLSKTASAATSTGSAAAPAGGQVLPLPPPPSVVPTPTVTPVALTTPLSDADVRRMLPGKWKLADAYGALILSLGANGIYETYRETVAGSTVQQVFAKVPVSSGTWTFQQGAVVFNCTSASQPERVHRTFPFYLRTITPQELVFVDYAGNSGKAVRTP